VESGKGIRVGDSFLVETSIDWSRQEIGDIEGWTVDGAQLQRLVFIQGIPDGKPLMGSAQEKAGGAPPFHSSMTSMEIMDLFLATLARTGAYDLKAGDLRPCRLGGLEGFRFEFHYTNRQGLKYKGFITGAQKDRRLFAVMYVGTALHHFERHHQEIERILASLVIL
jgi:hypothetical protein